MTCYAVSKIASCEVYVSAGASLSHIRGALFILSSLGTVLKRRSGIGCSTFLSLPRCASSTAGWLQVYSLILLQAIKETGFCNPCVLKQLPSARVAVGFLEPLISKQDVG
jgi:hypothetical protein